MAAKLKNKQNGGTDHYAKRLQPLSNVPGYRALLFKIQDFREFYVNKALCERAWWKVIKQERS